MNPEKIAFVFGHVPEGFDPDDPDDRGVLLAERYGDNDDDPDDDDGEASERFRLAVHEVVATQIAAGDPPEVWAAAERMTAAGVERERAMGNLLIACLGPLQRTLHAGVPFDLDDYRARLDRLPLPTPDDVEEALIAIARDRHPIDVEDLTSAVADRFGYPADDPMFDSVATLSVDELVADGVIAFVGGQSVAHVPSLLDGVVLTHTISAAEIATDVLAVAADLGPLADPDGAPVVTADGVRFDVVAADRGNVGWRAPEGWLAGLGEGTTIAVRVPGGATVDPYADELPIAIEVLGAAPPVEAGLAAALRAVYEAGVAEVGLPATTGEVLVDLLAVDRARFTVPSAPLSALCEAAGLERRGHRVAHDPAQWGRLVRARRLARGYNWWDDDDEGAAATAAALAAFAGDAAGRLPVPGRGASEDPRGPRQPGAAGDERATPQAQRASLLAMHRDPRLLVGFTLALLGDGDDQEAEADAVGVAERMLAAAHRDGEVAVARWVAALVAERHYETLEAEVHLRAAIAADRMFVPALDRLAWYLADRGEATAALRLRDRIGPGGGRDYRAELAPFTAASGPVPGRNDRCWCGSGRKFKQCHQDRPAVAALADRVGWLCRKATDFVERRHVGLPLDLIDLAAVRAGSDRPDDIARALEDPLVVDIALHEHGGFAEFLRHRGPLLPDDERLLAHSWTLVDRSVHEVVACRSDEGLTVRDLRTGDVVEVRERALTRQVDAGAMICARVVPDGEGHQLIGGVFVVTPGTETAVLDIVERGDGEALLAYRARLDAPPKLFSREGEPSVRCRAVLAVADPVVAAAILDDLYERDEADGGPVWIEWHEIAEDERIVRAWLRFDGDDLVVEAMSEVRADRVLDELGRVLGGVTVRSDERKPFEFGSTDAVLPPMPPGPVLDPGDPEVVAAMTEIQDRMERRWCDEAVPALGGRTPRQVAADPTRREELVRLIASFPEPEPDDGAAGGFGFRPGRLRSLLDLEADGGGA